jgi:hypothetical protein
MSGRKGGELGVRGMRLRRERRETSEGRQHTRQRWRRSGTREMETSWPYGSVNGDDGYGSVGRKVRHC